MNLPFSGMVLLSAFSFIASVASKYVKSAAVDYGMPEVVVNGDR